MHYGVLLGPDTSTVLYLLHNTQRVDNDNPVPTATWKSIDARLLRYSQLGWVNLPDRHFRCSDGHTISARWRGR